MNETVEIVNSPATVTRRIAVSDLPSNTGIIAADIVSRAGAVLLPSGVDIGLLSSSINKITKKLLKEGIEFVLLKKQPQFSSEEINHLLGKIYSDKNALVDQVQAKKIIEQVNTLFAKVRKQEFTPELVLPLINMGEELAVEILKSPSVLFSLGKVQETDEYTFTHSFNVAVLTGFLANRIYPHDRSYLKKIVIGGMMHDIGKAKIPLNILNKPGPLTAAEFEIMQRHPILGVNMARSAGIEDRDILSAIGGHHEKWSGNGYPNKVSGDSIPKPARISAVADVFDALTAERAYKKGMPSKRAMNIILHDVITHFDPSVTRELLVSLGLYPPGSIVQLSDGTIGFVVSGGGKDLIRPVIALQEDAKGKKYDTPLFIDLKGTKTHIIGYLGSGSKRTL